MLSLARACAVAVVPASHAARQLLDQPPPRWPHPWRPLRAHCDRAPRVRLSEPAGGGLGRAGVRGHAEDVTAD